MSFGFRFGFGIRRAAIRARSAPLDAFVASLVVAYGLRRLVSTWTGPLVTVRRSTDNATLDVYAAGDGWINTAALLAWTGSASAYVVKWWDQSGRGAHAVQTAAASQPELVISGVLSTISGRPALNVGPGSGFLSPTAIISGEISLLVSIRCASYSGATTRGVAKGSSGGSAVIYINPSTSRLSMTYSGQSIIGPQMIDGTPYVAEVLIDGPRSSIKIDGVLSSAKNQNISEGSFLYSNLQILYVDGDLNKSINGLCGDFIVINKSLTDSESTILANAMGRY